MIRQTPFSPETTSNDLTIIVEKARYLSERLEDIKNSVDNYLDDSLNGKRTIVDEKLSQWCQVVAQGNWEKFRRRLQWDNLDLQDVRRALSDRHSVKEQALPEWAATLGTVIRVAQSQAEPPLRNSEETKERNLAEPDISCLDSNFPVAFEEVLNPFLIVARQQLIQRLQDDSLLLKLVSEDAYRSLQRSLLNRLVLIASRTLYHEFSHTRPLGYDLFNQLFEIAGSTSQNYYNSFVEKLLQDGLFTFFQTYPVLGRLMATVVNFWVEAIAEFLLRLNRDQQDLQETFTPSSTLTETSFVSDQQAPQLGRVVQVQTSISDSHQQGRSVIICTFESGLKVVYKPRALEIEVVYNHLLDWCNQSATILPLKVLKVLHRQDYSWVEYVEHLPCTSEAAVARFYQRAGTLLGLVYVLGGNDCHHENIIANGEHLTLIDVETLMHPEANLLGDAIEGLDVESSTRQKFWNSVLRTGLLPRWQFDRNLGVAYDVSGLGSIDDQPIPWRKWIWQSVNTDDMHLAQEISARSTKSNIPILNGRVALPQNHLPEIISGFEQMYQFIVQHRALLLAENSLLLPLKSQQLRFLFRATQIYSDILSHCLAPQYLRNGIDFGIELDVLSRAFLTVQAKPAAWTILHAETKAMEQLDIPYFSVEACQDDLDTGLGQPISHYFKQSSFDQIKSQLQNLSETDLANQIEMICGAFRARVAQSFTPNRNHASPNEPVFLDRVAPLSPDQLLQEANAIAQTLHNQAIWEPDGNVNWIGLEYEPRSERYQLQPLGINLYDGKCGIALFLAALDSVTGQDHHRELIGGALSSLRQFLHHASAESAQRFVQAIGLGGATGLGSIIYSFTKISQFLNESSFLNDAQQFANWITPAHIAFDQKRDIVQGAAGAILGLLSLHQLTGNSAILDKAVMCGRYLVENRVSTEGQAKAWQGIADKPLTGFSHGAAGIAYALLKLYQIAPEPTFLQAAQEGIAFERNKFSTRIGNSIDFHLIDQDHIPGFRVRWCYGVPGIVLARLGGLPVLDTDAIRQEIDSALQVTQDAQLGAIAHLCCGDFGLIETLLSAAQKLDRPDISDKAQRRAAYLVTHAQTRGAYRLFTNLPEGIFHPSFFQGTTGIGYTLLRLAYTHLPSVLLWE